MTGACWPGTPPGRGAGCRSWPGSWTRADRLGRRRAGGGRRVSIRAGFVDPGESAEQAVVREVGEESGIKVKNVRYVGSQPWPMPRSLMLVFRADAPAGQAITVDHDELAEAHRFSRDEVLEIGR